MIKAATEDLARHIVVWLAQVSDWHGSLVELETRLDPRERERATHFHFAEDRARFLTGRGLLRFALQRYLPDLFANVELGYTPLGRPVVPGLDGLAFSLSHSNDLLALALTCNAQVGVDVEFAQTRVDVPALAERILGQEDFVAFQRLPADQWPAAFYRAWTRKEAYLKARGEGIGTGLAQVTVSFGAEAVSTLTDLRDRSGVAWKLESLPVAAGYYGCLACDEASRSAVYLTVSPNKDEIALTPLPTGKLFPGDL